MKHAIRYTAGMLACAVVIGLLVAAAGITGTGGAVIGGAAGVLYWFTTGRRS